MISQTNPVDNFKIIFTRKLIQENFRTQYTRNKELVKSIIQLLKVSAEGNEGRGAVYSESRG